MNKPRQIPLPLACRPAQGRADFREAPANSLALAKVDNWTTWPGNKLILVGPSGAGKSHLAAVWAAQSGAGILAAKDWDGEDGPLAIEDVDEVAGDRAAEERIFHGYNRATAAAAPLLFTASEVPSAAGYTLPDLLSRLQSVDIARIEPPDDALLTAVIVKHFADRQLNIAHVDVQLIVRRIERSFAAAARVAEEIDMAALAKRRKVTTELVRGVLSQCD